MTLRVLHLRSSEKDRFKSIAAATTSYVSPENEALVEKSIKDICQRLMQEARVGLETLSGCAQHGQLMMLEKLWEEQMALAKGALQHNDTALLGHALSVRNKENLRLSSPRGR